MGISSPCTDDPWKVRDVHDVGVDRHDPADAHASQVLVDQRARSPEPDDPDLLVGE
jgi:hypothetical protein